MIIDRVFRCSHCHRQVHIRLEAAMTYLHPPLCGDCRGRTKRDPARLVLVAALLVLGLLAVAVLR